MESSSCPAPQDSASPTTLGGHGNSQCSKNHTKLNVSSVIFLWWKQEKIQLFQPLKSPKKGASSIFYTSYILHISQVFINSTVWTIVSVPADHALCQANRKTIKHIPATLLLLQHVVWVPAQWHLQLKYLMEIYILLSNQPIQEA